MVTALKQLACRNALVHYTEDRLHPHVDCGWTDSGEDVEHVIRAFEEHAVTDHDIDVASLPHGVRDRIREAMRTA